jgi:D-arabinose 5-phosphate isomerase GutQ
MRYMAKTGTEVIDQARSIVSSESEALTSLKDQLDGSIIRILDLMLHCEGHILTTGAGTSHAVALRFAHLLSCSGAPALCVDAADALHGASGAVTPKDILFVISKGGQSDEVNKFVSIAKTRGAKIIAQTENDASPLALLSDAVYKVVAPEGIDPFGMVATGSSLLNCAAGDILCALLIELRGYTISSFVKTHPGGAVGLRIQEDSLS